jgi:glycosyltransferase involved in cell wall biosynthesis
MRIALLTEGGYPYARGEGSAWCDRLVRGLPAHEFEVYALGRSERREAAGPLRLPPNVAWVSALPLWGPAPDAVAAPRRRSLVLAQYRELAVALTAGSEPAGQADRFASALYGLAELARDEGGLPMLLRSEAALRALEDACRAQGVRPPLGVIGVADLLTAADLLERALRPLSAPWYDPHETSGLAGADICHAVSGGTAVLPGLLAKRFFGTPLLVTEHGVRLREVLLANRAAGLSTQVRSLLTAFHRLLAGEAYREAALVTPGNTHARRWQQRCGAERTRIRTVYPGYSGLEAAEGESPVGDDPVLVWVGQVAPAKDLVALLHAFAEIRREEPAALLRIVSATGGDAAYLAHCRALAAQLFPDEAENAVTIGENPVSFEEIGSPELPGLADAYAAGDVVVLSSIVEGFPRPLVEAMFSARATVSTDVGAVREVIGGTGLVVPPRNPKALAEACLALLREPERRVRLGAAARERALELFTVEQNVRAFREMYLELVAHCAGRAVHGEAVPFDRPAESHVPGHWTATPAPRWAREPLCQGVTGGFAATHQEEPA